MVCYIVIFQSSPDNNIQPESIALCSSSGKLMLDCCWHCQVFVLHSIVPKEEQEAAMQPAMSGHCKVVLSTNIAESSVTIPDVRLIINSGLQRYVLQLSTAGLPSLHHRLNVQRYIF